MFPILIIDDAREDLILTEAVLRHCKILNPIHMFATGKEFIEFLAERRSPERYLIFQDLSMQPMSGLEILRVTADHPGIKQSFIVMLSGIRDIKMVRGGYQLGARTFLIKPLAVEDVMGLLATAKDHIWVEERGEGYALHWVSGAPVEAEDSEEKKRRVE
jgi:response regulator RpfG family c-di-GMP phosphodiesterase